MDPNMVWDPDNIDTLEYCTGANPVMNLINCTSITTTSNNTPAPPPPGFVPTPIRAPPVTKLCPDKMSTPQQPPGPPSVTVCDSPATGTETPLLHYNSISTPLHMVNSPAHMSGVSALNLTSDSDISQTHLQLPAFMPPPLRYNNSESEYISIAIIILGQKLREL